MEFVGVLTSGLPVIWLVENSLLPIMELNPIIQFIKCGVPQGSILGPLLFLLYINDLASVCQYTFPILFADDSNLFISGNDVDLIMKTLN